VYSSYFCIIRGGHCANCGQADAAKFCARCLICCYCSRECQLKHWKQHKKYCKKNNSQNPTTEAAAVDESVAAAVPEFSVEAAISLVMSTMIADCCGVSPEKISCDKTIHSLFEEMVYKRALDVEAFLSVASELVNGGEAALFREMQKPTRKVAMLERDEWMVASNSREQTIVPAMSLNAAPYVFVKCHFQSVSCYKMGTTEEKVLEATARHPGTRSTEDDLPLPPGMDPVQHAPIRTKAARALHGIRFVAGGGGSSSNNNSDNDNKNDRLLLLPAYPLQLSARLDRRALYYDCFAFQPRVVVRSGTPRPNQSANIKILQRAFSLSKTSVTALGPPEPRDATVIQLQALAGEFVQSSVFRVRMMLSTVIGIRLLEKFPFATDAEENEIPAVLVLEFSQPPDSFAERKVGVEGSVFRLTEDWTEEKTASRATRHYLHGGLTEMKELAAHLARASPTIQGIVTGQRPNTLDSSNLLFSHATSFEVPSGGSYLPRPVPVEGSFNGVLSGLNEAAEGTE